MKKKGAILSHSRIMGTTTEIDLSAMPIGWYYAILAEILLLTILLCAHRLKGIIQESNLDGQRKRERSQPADHD
ncbi:hypothetical protein [Robbsia andropogonis]|uniref:hypothetical protein n=1 Tax=Robbsia andropogonis TaxID=28092 RepID=UPI0020A182CD|nr:hypothetical protein [Robbsia andropogonis]MCP1119617.1 hypothetical protein [Robbsia andropogonis]MCP1129600.1 hypothetical protein [Robbsia andropogonis]